MNFADLLRDGLAIVPGPALSAAEGAVWLSEWVGGWGSVHGISEADDAMLHTEGSLEDVPPRYVGLFVIGPGGCSEWVSAAEVLERVSGACRVSLREPADRGPLLCGPDLLRYPRDDFPEFAAALEGPRVSRELAEGSLLLLDNWRFLHRASQVLKITFFGPEVPVVFGDVGQWRSGLSLFEQGLFWEAHEAWEELWHLCQKQSCAGLVLRGLIQAAAACLKSVRGEERGVAILSARAAATLRSAGVSAWNGVDLERLCAGLDGLRVGERLWL